MDLHTVKKTQVNTLVQVESKDFDFKVWHLGHPTVLFSLKNFWISDQLQRVCLQDTFLSL